MPHHANTKYNTGTACATHTKCSKVMSGKCQANAKEPTVNKTSPTTPHTERRVKADASGGGGCEDSESEALKEDLIKAVYLANDFQVSITLSGLSEIELMPSSANQSAKSG